ncbi:MAG TPA: amino acid adenylation domain-containing protein [Pyrinomonadaceae bacterium]
MLRKQGYNVNAEQDELLVGTDRWNVYAVREGIKPATNGHEQISSAARSLTGAELCAELRTNLRARLPEYMVPAAIVLLDKLPLTRNGKVDRRALPAPEEVETADDEQSTTTLTPVEEMLAGIWSEVLRVKQIKATDNFFDLGGHSLLATQLTSRVREVFQIELPLRTLFESPILTDLATRIEHGLRAQAGLQTPPLVRAERGAEAPLSFAQQRLWFLDQLEPNSAFYNSPQAVRLSGRLDQQALAQTFSEIVRRHEVLRTSFKMVNGEPRQVVSDSVSIPMPLVDVSAIDEPYRETVVRQLAYAEAGRPFDLGSGPLMRVQLLRKSDDEHVVLLTMHHIVSDGWSVGVFINEVASLYRAYSEQPGPQASSPAFLSPAEQARTPAVLPELEVQYADYAIWQRNWLQGEALDNQMRYWETQLRDLSTLELPTDRSRPALQSHTGARHAFSLNTNTSTDLKQVSQHEGATLFMTLLAALQLLLARYSGQTDIVVGAPIAGRTRRELEPLIGFFVNTLVLRTSIVPQETFSELLARVKAICLGAYAHQDVPFEKLVEELQPERDLSRSPLFQVALSLQNTPSSSLELPGLSLRGLSNENLLAKFDLTINFNEDRQGQLHYSLLYATDLFEAATIERMSQHFGQLCNAIADNREHAIWQFPLLTAPELTQLQTWNATATTYPPHTSLHQLIEDQVERTPNAVALSFEGKQLPYVELNKRANQLAHHLRELSVQRDQLVGIAMERSLELVVALLAVLKAGAAYVPLDPEYPRERLAFMLQDADVSVLLTQNSLLSQLPEHHAQTICVDSEWNEISKASAANPDVTVNPDNLAYVIYTSGSTGTPKAAMNSHRAICNRLLWMQEAFHLTEHDRVLQKTPFSFDVSVWEFFWPLMYGAQLVVARPGGHRDSAYLANIIAEEQITTLHFVPSLLRVWLEEPHLDRCENLRRVICSGEALDHGSQEKFFSLLPEVELHNLYGPTEAAVDVTAWHCDNENGLKIVPIGRPIANLQIHLLDQQLQPVPVGVKGELYIGGVGLARGYWSRPDLTAERFVPDPFSPLPGARLYRSGDEARYLPDGNIDYAGRLDHQIKIRGLRIELGEIESTLANHPAIDEAVVIARDYGAGDTRLIAYLVPDQQQAATLHELLKLQQSDLREQLYELPNGLPVVQQNKGETDFLYQEIFTDQTYLKHVDLPADAVIFDVGANIGLFTLFAGQASNEVTVYAFEPLPPLFKVLEANARLHRVNAKLFPCGLAQEARTEQFTFYPHCTILSGRFANQQEESTVLKSYMLNDDDAQIGDDMVSELLSERLSSEQFDCELRTISDVIAEHAIERIDLLKIDVEKSELDVIAGIKDHDWKKIRQLIVEVHDRDGRLDQVRNLLEQHGYQITIEQDSFLKQTELYNVYAVRSENRAGSKPVIQKQKHWTTQEQLLSDVEQYLQQKLPAYMAPAHFVFLHELPLTPNGKLDRKALPELQQTRRSAGETIETPRTTAEEILVTLFRQVLKTEQVSINDNFFTLGGHSLLATQLVSRIRKIFEVDLPLRVLFESPVLSQLAARIEYERRAGKSMQIPPLRRVERDGRAVLSFAQQRLWFLDQFEPDTASYNNPMAVRLSGNLNKHALQRTFTEIVRRHEVLRTTFQLVNGEPLQVIAEPGPFSMLQVDLTGLDELRQEVESRRLAQEDATMRLDLSRDQLLRVKLVEIAPKENLVLMTMHHIISDGWSMGVLNNEIATLYRAYSEQPGTQSSSPAFLPQAEQPVLPELELQYADYATWQRDWLQGEVLERQTSYWKEKLRGVEPLELPTDRPRPPIQSFKGASYAFALSPQVGQQLQAVAKQEGATLFMTLLAALQVLLTRYSGQSDSTVGTPIAGRIQQELEPLIGLFINTLVLRNRVDSDKTFRELLSQAREVCLEAYAHQDVPFEKLVQELQPERDLSRSPLFQVMLSFQTTSDAQLELPGLRLSSLGNDTVPSKFDLAVNFAEDNQANLRCSITYTTALFDESTIARLSSHLIRILETIPKSLDQPIRTISLLTPAEQEELRSWNLTTVTPVSAECIHEVFTQQAELTPEVTAIVFGENKLSYHELNSRSNQLTHYLKAVGVGPEVIVGICMERSLELVVALLGVLKAGGTYLPIDPDYPSERIDFILEDAAAAVLLMHDPTSSALPAYAGPIIDLDADWDTIATSSNLEPGVAIDKDNGAYVLYTSGSTGQPKGVFVPHRAIANHMQWMLKELAFNDSDRVLQKTPYTFDASVWEFYAPLLCGGTLVMAKPKAHLDPVALASELVQHRITQLQVVPTMLKLLVEEPGMKKCTTLQRVFCGGEALTPDLVQRFHQQLDTVELCNLYGPTEATIDATIWRSTPGASVSLGRPVWNTQLYVLGKDLELLPVGIAGELYIGGVQLARGYVGKPELTAERFVPHPYGSAAGERLYHTGDLGRYAPNGDIVYLGRADNQVKIRGYRIELGEIEGVLRGHSLVRDCVVSTCLDKSGQLQLAGYVVTTGETISKNDLRTYLQHRLPDHLVPNTFVLLDKLPLNANGKIDRRALPHPEESGSEEVSGYDAPRTPVEDLLAVLWSDVLAVEQVSIHDNFFELGGHSLFAAKLVARIKESFGVDVPLRSIFECHDLAQLATVVEKALRRDGNDEAPIAPIPRAGTLPISVIQERVWYLSKTKQRSARSRNMNLTFHLRGDLHYDLLEKTLTEMSRRHEILRTTYTKVGESLVPVVGPPVSGLPRLVDLQGTPVNELEQAARRLVKEASVHEFDLAGDILIDALLIRLSDRDHVLNFAIDHFIFDGWSADVFMNEMAIIYGSLYHKQPAVLPELPVQFIDWANWHQERFGPTVDKRFLELWKQRLDMDHPFPTIELPGALPKPAVLTRRAQTHTLMLSPEMLEELEAFVRNERITMFILLATTLKALLHAYTGKERVGLLSASANRQRPETQRVLGWLSTLIMLPTDLGGDPSLSELLARVRETCLNVYEHAALPLHRLMELLDASKDEAKHTSEQTEEVGFRIDREAPTKDEPYVFLTVQTSDRSKKAVKQKLEEQFARVDLLIDRLAVDPSELIFGAGISVNVEEIASGLKLSAVSEVDRYKPETMVEFLNLYKLAIETIIADPDRKLSTLVDVIQQARTN